MNGHVPGEFKCHFQSVHELIDLDWFGEIPEEPACRPFSMSRGMALALRATTGICAVSGIIAKDFKSLDAADAGKVDVHEDHVRLVGSRKLDAPVSVSWRSAGG